MRTKTWIPQSWLSVDLVAMFKFGRKRAHFLTLSFFEGPLGMAKMTLGFESIMACVILVMIAMLIKCHVQWNCLQGLNFQKLLSPATQPIFLRTKAYSGSNESCSNLKGLTHNVSTRLISNNLRSNMLQSFFVQYNLFSSVLHRVHWASLPILPN